MDKIEYREQKRLVLKRVPPGDRWSIYKDTSTGDTTIYNSLTDALEAWYQKHGDTKFYIDARKGTVEIVYEERVEPKIEPEKKFSIYGEE
jgi:hypothetical protein